MGLSKKHGLPFASYFYQLSKVGDYNTSFYGKESKGSVRTDVIDPFKPEQFIDAIHLFASIDGAFASTLSPVNSGLRGDLFGWAGDLQCEVEKIVGNEESFQKVMENANSLFPYGDLAADVDAMNVSRMFLDANAQGNNALSSSLQHYYQENRDSSLELRTRYRSFLSSAVGNSIDANQHPVCFTFCSKAFSCLHLVLQSRGKIIESNENFETEMGIKFHLLGAQETLSKTFEHRVLLAKLFFHYVLEQAGCAEEVTFS